MNRLGPRLGRSGLSGGGGDTCGGSGMGDMSGVGRDDWSGSVAGAESAGCACSLVAAVAVVGVAAVVAVAVAAVAVAEVGAVESPPPPNSYAAVACLSRATGSETDLVIMSGAAEGGGRSGGRSLSLER